jgi:hypothetical protein
MSGPGVSRPLRGSGEAVAKAGGKVAKAGGKVGEESTPEG